MTDEPEQWTGGEDPWRPADAGSSSASGVDDPWRDDAVPGSSDQTVEVSWPLVKRVDDDQLVWHYTTTTGLFGILTSGTLRASSATMLNDTTEMTHGLELLEETRWNDPLYLDDLQENFLNEVLKQTRTQIRGNDVMVACASTEGDDLAQWRAYAAGSGYAVGLRPLRLTAVDVSGKQPLIYRGIVDGVPSGWSSVEYAYDAKVDLIRRALRYAVSMLPDSDASAEDILLRRWAATSTLTTVIPFLKHQGFVSEREVRQVHLLGDIESGAVQIRTSPFGLTPYVDLAVALDRAGTDLAITTAQPGKLPIDRIRVGPGPNQEAAARGLESSLPILGYPDVGVDVSVVPFR